MVGLPIGRELLSDLERLMKTQGFYVRRNAARVIREDPRGDFAEETAKLLLEGLASAARLPDAQSPSRGMGRDELGWSTFSDLFTDVTGALLLGKGFDLELLKRLTPSGPGLQRECLIVARRLRGDESVRAEYRRVMEHAADPGVRMAAIMGLRYRPTPEDRAVLERIAESDPHTFRPYPRRRGEVPELRYPVRERAKVVLGKPEDLRKYDSAHD